MVNFAAALAVGSSGLDAGVLYMHRSNGLKT
jgi:hypothetical protein